MIYLFIYLFIYILLITTKILGQHDKSMKLPNYLYRRTDSQAEE